MRHCRRSRSGNVTVTSLHTCSCGGVEACGDGGGGGCCGWPGQVTVSLLHPQADQLTEEQIAGKDPNSPVLLSPFSASSHAAGGRSCGVISPVRVCASVFVFQLCRKMKGEVAKLA